MQYEVIHLKDYFDFLGNDGCDPTLECFVRYNMREMNRQDDLRPSMLICPGGGYGMVSEREWEPVAVHFLPMGLNAFVLNYSVAPHRFPTQLIEVAAALEVIRINAKKWGCDVGKIGIMGFSAGGHLAAHYSNAYKCDEVRKCFPESIRPFASVLGYPVISADEQITHRWSIENLLGYFPQGATVEKFSCEKLVSEDTPQAFIWHTAEDTCVPAENSLVYAQSLLKFKIPYSLHIYPYGAHGLSTADNQTNAELSDKVSIVNEWLDSLKKWVKITFFD